MLDNVKYHLCNNGKQFSLNNGNPFNSMTMQASYDDFPKSQTYPKRSSTVGAARQKQPTVQTTQCLKHIFSQTIVKFEHFVNKVNEMLTLVELPASSQNRLHWKPNF